MSYPYSYCIKARSRPPEDPDRVYHDTVYGFPATEDSVLFGRLVMEIQQAGLSWTTVLKKEASIASAFGGFCPLRVAAFSEEERERCLHHPGSIRHRGKMEAICSNAQQILSLQRTHGSFRAWLSSHRTLSCEEWVKLFAATFTFTGPRITESFLLATGYLPGAHAPECPVYTQVLERGASSAEEIHTTS